MYEYSITIRPRVETFKVLLSSVEVLVEWCKKKCKNYIIGLENGCGDETIEPNHFQCVMSFEKKRKNIKKDLTNLIGKILKLHKLDLDDLEETEKKIMLKCPIIKSNSEGVKGYCLKESIKNYSNYNPLIIKQFIKVYNEEKLKNYEKKQKKEYYKVNKRNYHMFIKKYIQMYYPEEKITEDLIIQVIDEMMKKDYYFTFINSKNIGDIISYVKGHLTDFNYVRNCYEEYKEMIDRYN